MTSKLCTYIPSSILEFLEDKDSLGEKLEAPMRQEYTTAVMFADISGFTAMSEALAAEPQGDENLAKYLNSYFEQLVRIVLSHGGDVFKFAGDAIICLWCLSNKDADEKEKEEELVQICRRAAECAMEINDNLQEVHVAGDIYLSIKVGLGVGNISILHVGGVYGRLEYVAIGEPLVQAFNAEHHAHKKEIVASPEIWSRISEYFVESKMDEGFAFLKECKQGSKLEKKSIRASTSGLNETVTSIMKYVPASVSPWLKAPFWASELRRICCLFVNLGISEERLLKITASHDMITVQKVVETVQQAVYQYEGSLNKFLMDDKGSTLIAVFGLPPLAHEDDSVRGVLSALQIRKKLELLEFKASIGITTGSAYCGVVGNANRREYSILGDTVNLSARLMQYALKQYKGKGGIVCDGPTYYICERHFKFKKLSKIKVKGKVNPIPIYLAKRSQKTQDPWEYHDIHKPKNIDDVKSQQEEMENVLPGLKRQSSPLSSVSMDADMKDGLLDNAESSKIKRKETLTNIQARIRTFTKTSSPSKLHLVLKDSFSSQPSSPKVEEIKLAPPICQNDDDNDSNYEIDDEENQFEIHRITLSNEIAKFVKLRKSSSFLIQADLGLGKSRLILYALKDPPHELQVIHTRGNPYEMETNFSAWREIFLQLIDSRIPDSTTGAEKSISKKLISARHKLIMTKLTLRKSITGQPFSDLVGVLNEIFPSLNLPENATTKAFEKSTRLRNCEALLILFMKSFVEEKPVVVVIDDAIFLDSSSWDLSLKMSTEVPDGLMMILASRPMNQLYMAAFSGPIPQSYNKLLGSSKIIQLEPLSERVIRVMAKGALAEEFNTTPVQIKTIPKPLMQLIVRKAQGTPLVVKELIYELKKDGLIHIARGDTMVKCSASLVPENYDGPRHFLMEKSKGKLSKDTKYESKKNHKSKKSRRGSIHRHSFFTSLNLGGDVVVPVPITIQSILGCRLDRLTQYQAMILKTAAVISNTFPFDWLKRTFPLSIDYEFQLELELKNLRKLNILKKEYMGEIPGPSGWEAMYTFIDGFMRDMLLSRMLVDQQTRINQDIKRIRSLPPSERLFYRGKLAIASVIGPLLLLKKTWGGDTDNGETDINEEDIDEERGFVKTKNDRASAIAKRKTTLTNFKRLEELTPLYPRWDCLWCVLQDDLVTMWRTEAEAKSAHIIPNRKRPIGVIFLKNCSVSELCRFDLPNMTDTDRDDHGFYDDMELDEKKLYCNIETYDYTFILDGQIWMWEGDYHGGGDNFQFQFAAETKKDAETWLMNLRDAIAETKERIESRANLNPILQVREEENKKCEEELRIEFSNSSKRTVVIPSTELKVQKHSATLLKGTQWKKRYICLTHNAIYFFKKKLTNLDPRWAKPSQVIALNVRNVSVKEGLYSDHTAKIFIFQVNSELWMKNSRFNWSKRRFVFGCSTQDDAQRWINVITRMIDSRHGTPSRSPSRIVSPRTKSQGSCIFVGRTDSPNSRSASIKSIKYSFSRSKIDPINDEKALKMIDTIIYGLKTQETNYISQTIDSLLQLRPYMDAVQQESEIIPFHELVAGANISSESKEWLKSYFPHSDRAPLTFKRIKGNKKPTTPRATSTDSTTSISSSISNVGSSTFVNSTDLSKWNFDIFALTQNALMEKVVHIFQTENLLTYCRISKEKLYNWLKEVCKGYRSGNPYHNFRHGVDVCQTLFVMLRTFGGCGFLGDKREQKILGLLIAALVHDLDHPGLNNDYQINSQSELALLYNDNSVLENHHCSKAFHILRNPDVNILSNIPRDEYCNSLRPLICKLILSTDMSHHFSMLHKFEKLKEDAKITPNDAKPVIQILQESIPKEKDLKTIRSPGILRRSISLTPEERLTVMSTMLHTADISNPCKTWKVSEKWASFVLKEFLSQGDREKLEGLPVSPNCDRDTSDGAQLSLQFIDFIVAPQFLALQEILSEAQICLDFLITNRNQWNMKLVQNIHLSIQDEKKKEEQLEKWKKRNATFHSKYFPGKEPISSPKRDSNERRRSSTFVAMQDYLLANTASALPVGETVADKDSVLPAPDKDSVLPAPAPVPPKKKGNGDEEKAEER